MTGTVPAAFPHASAIRDSRVCCKNAAVCRRSIVAPAALMLPSYAARGLCLHCDIKGGHELDIVASTEECPVCYEPMELGVKWNADSCAHRFCAACFHQMIWGRPRPPYEHVDVCRADTGGWGYALIHDDGQLVDYCSAERDDAESPIAHDSADSADSDDDAAFGERGTCPICARPWKGPAWG